MSKEKIFTTVALIGAASVAAVLFVKTFKAVKSLENIDLDFGNDVVLSSIFKKG